MAKENSSKEKSNVKDTKDTIDKNSTKNTAKASSKNSNKNPSKNQAAQKTGKKAKTKSGAVETFEDAFIHELSDIKNAEMQLVKALPRMAKAASNQNLAEALETHAQETEEQIQLIEQVVKSLKIKLKRETCDAMKGLLKEGQKIMKDIAPGTVRDVMLIAAAQKVEHYEIASYGCLVAAAKQLGYEEAADLLEQILDQEKQTDEKLNQLAEGGLNEEAFQQTQQTSKKGKMRMSYNQERNSGNRQYRDRDEDSRFMSDDDNNRSNSRGRSSSSRSRNDDDDRSQSRSYRSSQSSGRYDHDDDRSQGRSSNRDRYDRDDDNRSSSQRGRGQGWFGDSEGHAEAGRQSHGGRGQSDDSARGRSSYNDNDRYDNRSSRSNSRNDRDDNRDYYDDDQRSSSRRSSSQQRGRGQGWFGDSEGHAEAGRHSHDNDGRRRSSSGRR